MDVLLRFVFLVLLLVSSAAQYPDPEQGRAESFDGFPFDPYSTTTPSLPHSPWFWPWPGQGSSPSFEPGQSYTPPFPWRSGELSPPSSSDLLPRTQKEATPPLLKPAGSSLPLLPWAPRHVVPPSVTPKQSSLPLIPETPRQIVPPPFTPTQSGSSSPQLPRTPAQVTPPSTPSQSSSPLIPKAPRQIIPTPLVPFPPTRSNSPLLPRVPRQKTPSSLTPVQSNSPSPPQAPRRIYPPLLPEPPSESSSFYQMTQQQRGLPFAQQTFLLQQKSSNRARAVGTAVGVTAAITLIGAGVAICLMLKYRSHRRRQVQSSGSVGGVSPGPGAGGEKNSKNLKGLIVDEKGQRVIYWGEQDDGANKPRNSFSTEAFDQYKERLKAKEKGKQPVAPILEAEQQPESLAVATEPLVPVQAMASRRPPLRPKQGEAMFEKGNLKPLRRESVTSNLENARGGSFSHDDDLMEAIFGSIAAKKGILRKAENRSPLTPSGINSSSSEIVLLDLRRSQKIAAILRSVEVSRDDLLDALDDGEGLDTDVLEKLTRIAPTKREESLILSYRGHPPRLAQAESFLYHTLKAVPLAFPRLRAMLFRSNYRSENLDLDKNVHILERGCSELRESKVLIKLIQAVLKAGNDKTAGTAAGDTEAYDLRSLEKIFDGQCSDGNTSIVYSVVEEMAISEGKQCVLNRDQRMNLSKKTIESSSQLSKQNSKKYLLLGLPLVSGLSAGFPNVKKAASIDYGYFLTSSSALASRLADIQHTISQCATINGRSSGFVIEMNRFLETTTGELRQKQGEQTRVIKLVQRTIEFYQGGALTTEDANPFQLFAIVKVFLEKVDEVCVHISQNLQRRKGTEESTGSAK